MFKIIKYTAFVFFAASLFVSCRKELNIDLPPGENKLTMNGLLMPDSTIRVHLGRSRNILDNSKPEDFELTGATLKLYKNGTFVADMVYVGNGYYETEIMPEIGAEYKAVATHSEFNNAAEAMCVIHQPVEIQDFSIKEEIEVYDGWEQTIRTLSLKFTEDQATKNYYMIALHNVSEYEYYDEDGNLITDTYSEYINYFSSTDPIFTENESEMYNQSLQYKGLYGVVFNDNLIASNVYTLKLDGGFLYAKKNTLTAYIYSIDEDLYKYTLSYHANRNTTDNPFAEPVSVFSNIEGGIGIFAGMAAASKTIVCTIENDYPLPEKQSLPENL